MVATTELQFNQFLLHIVTKVYAVPVGPAVPTVPTVPTVAAVDTVAVVASVAGAPSEPTVPTFSQSPQFLNLSPSYTNNAHSCYSFYCSLSLYSTFYISYSYLY
jgi:hypothetical protein